MADDSMSLLETLRKVSADGDVDVLREGVRLLAQAIMEAEVSELTGLPKGERNPEQRLTHRNGYRDRRWDTRVGTIELAVPRVRDGSYFPSLLEPRRRAERALLAVVQEAYVSGVSTRRVDDLVRTLGIEGISRSKVSRICAALDAEVAAFRSRSLADLACPYLWLDATYLKVREGGRVVSMAALIATGVAASGERRVLGLELSPGNDEGSAWPRFVRSLVERGLHGVRLVISDNHAGLVKAIDEQLLGAAWQRSSVHSGLGPRVPVSHPSGERLGSGDRFQTLRQTRASAREASPYRPEGDVLRAPTMSVPGGLRRAARRGVEAGGHDRGGLRRARLGRAASPGPRARRREYDPALGPGAARSVWPGAPPGRARGARHPIRVRRCNRAAGGVAGRPPALLGPPRLPRQPEGGGTRP